MPGKSKPHRHHLMSIGDTDNPEAIKTRIVHISDTHLKHDDLLANSVIPDGDILVHSGDFSNFSFLRAVRPERDIQKFVHRVDTFFNSLPHKHKIFVPGNHDMNIDEQSWERMQSLLSSCIYLQDISVTVEGLKFYGAGWNLIRGCSSARSFAVEPEEIAKCWDKIPTDTEILVTHSPPYAILDCSYVKRQGGITQCKPKRGCGHNHIGCPTLREVVLNSVKPKVHLFGHNHGANGAITYKDILFSNGAMCARPVPAVIDYYRKPDIDRSTIVPVSEWTEEGRSCALS